MSEKFNIHDWQDKQRRLSEADNKEIDEANVTSTGASFTAGDGEGYATPKMFTKKNKNTVDEADTDDVELDQVDSRVLRMQTDVMAIDRADEFMFALGALLSQASNVPNLEQILNDTFGKDKSFVQLLKNKIKELKGNPLALLRKFQDSQTKI